MIKQIKSKARVADHGEVFTAKREVDAMLDLGNRTCRQPLLGASLRRWQFCC